MSRTSPENIPQPPAGPALDGVELLWALGLGVGGGRYRARLPDGAEVAILFADERAGSTQALLQWGHQLAAVDHTAVPRVVRVEDTLSPTFIATEYAQGETLEDRLAVRQAPMAEVDALSITLQVAAGLRAAHDVGLHHGGLTTRSVLLLPRSGAMDAVKVVGWRPPMRAQADGLTIDLRALGGLLYTCLTGAAPPSAETLSLEPMLEDGTPLEGEGGGVGAFDGVLMGWAEADHALSGAGETALKALTTPEDFLGIDAFVEALVPHLEARLTESRQTAEVAAEAGRRFLASVETRQREVHTFESKLRFARAWLREEGRRTEEAARSQASLERRVQALEHARMELGMLLERRIVDAPTVQTPALERGPEPTPASSPAPVVLPPAPSPAPSSPAAETVEPLVEVVPDEVLVVGQGRSRWVLAAAALVVLVGVWIVVGGDSTEVVAEVMADAGAPRATRISRDATVAAELDTSKDAAPRDVTSAKPVLNVDAALAPKDAAPVPEVAPTDGEGPAITGKKPQHPPKDMVGVPAGRVALYLDRAHVGLIKAQCELDLEGERSLSDCALAFDEELPGRRAKTAKVGAFFIDRFEVSQGAYRACRNKKKCKRLGLHWDVEKQPATGVTQKMAARFCAYRGGRLPTYEEWLYAARGASNRIYPWGDGPVAVDDKHKTNHGRASGIYSRPSRADGHKYAAGTRTFVRRGISPMGASNMVGNVREWTSSRVAGQGVVVGGGWRTMPHDLRLTRQELLPPDTFTNDLGFRCVVDVPR